MPLRKTCILLSALLLALPLCAAGKRMAAVASDDAAFPDGTPIGAWFADSSRIDTRSLGRRYVLTDCGVSQDSSLMQTARIQAVIDSAANHGGGVVVVPRGVFLTGALFFRQGTHLLLESGARLKGSDRIMDYPIVDTRLEGQSLRYFAALINADSLQGFTITGPGCIDGNGHHYWREFWLRKQVNPQCTNLEALRPRLVYLSRCSDVTLQGVSLCNSAFWTTHLYRCRRVRYIGCRITAPTIGLRAPSSDAIDIDYCSDILVSHCYMSVNDDAVVLKGGKGTYADRDPRNGPNSRVVIDHCQWGRVHSCLTLGSECLHGSNIVMRHCRFTDADRVLWLKMRPDTPQRYEHIRLSDISGSCKSFIVARPWTQFYRPEQRDDMPPSMATDIAVRRATVDCRRFFDIAPSDKYTLRCFSFTDCCVTERSSTPTFNPAIIDRCDTLRLDIRQIAD